MINHARTLLLNMPANKAWRDAGSYEYIPPTFTPITLSSKLGAIRTTLFGAAPDNYFLNFRVRELLRYIHETELAHYVYALDPRVTYWPEYRDVDFSAPKQLKITQTAGQPRRVAVVGQFDVNNASGRAARQYTITLAPGTTTTFAATVAELNAAAAEKITTPFDSLNNAPALEVPQTSLKLRFSNTALTTGSECNIITEFGDMLLVEDYDPAAAFVVENDAECTMQQRMQMTTGTPVFSLSRWLLDVRARPPAAITTIMPILEMLGETTFLELFGVSTEEPYTTFKNLWLDHPLPAYKLSGLVLGFIYRCNEIYEKNNA